MLDINPAKLQDGRIRKMILEIYYENLFEKDKYSYDKLLNSFQKLVTGFGRATFMLNDEADKSIKEIQREIKQLHSDEEDVERLWELIEQFFRDNLETNVEEALSEKDYEVNQ